MKKVGVGRVGFVRSYGVSTSSAAACVAGDSDLPIGEWIDKRALRTGSGRQIFLHDLGVLATTETLELRSFVLYQPHIGIADVVVVADGIAAIAVDDLAETVWPVVNAPLPGLDGLTFDGAAGQAFDLIARQLGVEPADESVTSFGLVIEVEGDLTAHARTAEEITPGLAGLPLVHGRNRLVFEVDRPQTFDAYVLYAALASRTRHLYNRIVGLLLETLDDDSGDAWDLTRQAASLQRDVLIYHANMQPGGYFGDQRLLDLHSKTAVSVVLSESERQYLETVQGHLAGYVSAEFALAVDQTQARVGWFGLLFASVTIFYAAFEVFGALGRTSEDWVRFAQVNAVVAMAAVAIVSVVSFRGRSSRSRPRPPMEKTK